MFIIEFMSCFVLLREHVSIGHQIPTIFVITYQVFLSLFCPNFASLHPTFKVVWLELVFAKAIVMVEVVVQPLVLVA